MDGYVYLHIQTEIGGVVYSKSGPAIGLYVIIIISH
jgi:hypothetical protein